MEDQNIKKIELYKIEISEITDSLVSENLFALKDGWESSDAKVFSQKLSELGDTIERVKYSLEKLKNDYINYINNKNG